MSVAETIRTGVRRYRNGGLDALEDRPRSAVGVRALSMRKSSCSEATGFAPQGVLQRSTVHRVLRGRGRSNERRARPTPRISTVLRPPSPTISGRATRSSALGSRTPSGRARCAARTSSPSSTSRAATFCTVASASAKTCRRSSSSSGAPTEARRPSRLGQRPSVQSELRHSVHRRIPLHSTTTSPPRCGRGPNTVGLVDTRRHSGV